MASIQLRTLIDNVLQDTSRDMREQADSVDVSFQKRVEEVQDAKNKLEENLKKVKKTSLLKSQDITVSIYIWRPHLACHDSTAAATLVKFVAIQQC